MATQSKFQRVFNKAITSNTALVASISACSDFWLENLKVFVKLTEKVNALKDVDEELANAREQVKKGHDALNQALGAHTVNKDQNAELTR